LKDDSRAALTDVAEQEIEDTIGLERSLTRQQGHIETAFENSQNSLLQDQHSYR
jgi:hypothetical protein